MKIFRAREMTQCLGTAVLQEIWIQFPEPTPSCLQLSVTPGLEYQIAYSVLRRFLHPSAYMCMHK